MDEQWGWVGSKRRQHWLWYAFDTKRKKAIAHVFGPRTKQTLEHLLGLLKKFSIGFFTTDNYLMYKELLIKSKHLAGKIFTQRIERNNLTLRTRIKRLARKTICFSKSVEIHEKVIGTFFEKLHYMPLWGTTKLSVS